MEIKASKDQALMAPDASPGEKNKTGVRRVNNMPLILLACVVTAFVGVMMYVAAGKSAQQNAPAEQTDLPTAGNTTALAKEIAGSQTTGMVAPETPMKADPTNDKPLGQPNQPADSGQATITVVRPDNMSAPPAPPGGQLVPAVAGVATQSGGVGKDDLERLRNAKLQMFEEAIKAQPTVQSFKAGASRSTDPRDQLAMVRSQLAATNAASGDPTAVYQAKLQQLKDSLGSVGGSGAGSGSGSGSIGSGNRTGQGNDYAKFDSTGAVDRWRLDAEPEAPRSPYELRAGFVIPGLLISGINSDLPGQIMAQVSQNVYDTATGKYLLIPQGTRLVGQYSSAVAYGQNRVLVAWQRLIFPDGKALDIGSMPGADGAGYSGYKDKVNNHFWRIFGSSFLMSGIIAGVSMSQDQEDSESSGYKQRASDAMSEALGQQLGQAMTQMLMKNLNIAPTIEIRSGYRFNVIVNKDLTFKKPYQSFDY